MAGYVPDAGDLVWLNFDPQAGHEQTGRRPALVLSPKDYNLRAGLGLFCPVTNQSKGYPFEVPLPGDCEISGVILADHVKSSNWKARQIRRIGRVPQAILDEVVGRLAPLLGLLLP